MKVKLTIDWGEASEKNYVIAIDTPIRLANVEMLAKLKPDEPFWILRGQDALAGTAIRAWIDAAANLRVPLDKVDVAYKHLSAMEDYLPRKLPD